MPIPNLLTFRRTILTIVIKTKDDLLVEIFGTGGQFVGFGVHPTPGVGEYRWVGNGDACATLMAELGEEHANPLIVKLADLPEVTPEQLREFASQAVKLLTELGYADVKMTGAYDGKPVSNDVPEGMADLAGNIFRGRQYLKDCVARGFVSRIDHFGHDTCFEVAATLVRDLALSADTATELMLEIWYPKCQPSDNPDFVRERVISATTSGQNAIGAYATRPAVETFAHFAEQIAKMAAETGAKLASDVRNFDGLHYYRVTDIQAERIDWLWPHRLAIGKICLHAGYPGTGKSQYADDIAARLSTGADWPCGEGIAPLKATLILSAEDDKADTIKPRLMAAGANTDLIFVVPATVKTEGGVRSMNIEDDLERIDGIIANLARDGIEVGLIIIDPISAYVGGKNKGDSFKNTEMRAMLTPLGEWAALRRVAILAITHFNKGGNAHHDYKITDSLAFVAVARVISFSVAEVDDDGAETGRVLLLPGKTNIGAKAASLAYKIVGTTVHDAKVGDIPTSHIHWDGVVATTADDAFAEHSGKADKSEKAEDFLVLTLQDGPVLVPDIRRRAGSKHQWKTIERAKTKLKIISHREGFGPGSTVKWALPDPEPRRSPIGQQPSGSSHLPREPGLILPWPPGAPERSGSRVIRHWVLWLNEPRSAGWDWQTRVLTRYACRGMRCGGPTPATLI